MGDSGPSTLLSALLAVVLGGVLLMVVKRLCSLHSECVPSKPDGLSLPKGSFGWPIIGETLAFASNPAVFAQSRVKRYGSIFKSSLFFRKVILGSTPEFAKFVATNSNLFPHAFPKLLEKIVGPRTLLFENGPRHLSLKKLVSKSVGPDALRNEVQNFEMIILEHFASWERTGTVTGMNATQKLSWDTSNWVLFGDRHPSSTPEGKINLENFKRILRTTVSLPVILPGTTYTKGMKAKADLIAYFKKLVERRKGGSTNNNGVFFDALLAARDNPESREELKHLDDDTLAENIFFLNFAAYDTNAITLLWVMKILIDYPDVFRRVQAEQQEILNSKDPSVQGPRLTWQDIKKMVYTQKLFREIQRFVSLVPITFTEATEDVTYEGHLIPKGWTVCILVNSIHSDPATYPDLSFNPDRFDVAPKPYSYLPFSAGPHMCPGIDMAKLIMCIFVHHIATTYTHESTAPDTGLVYEGVMPVPRGGYPIKLRLVK